MEITAQNYPLLYALMTRIIEQRGPERPIGYSLPDWFPLDQWEAELAAMPADELAAFMAADRTLITVGMPEDLSVRRFADGFYSAGLDIGH